MTRHRKGIATLHQRSAPYVGRANWDTTSEYELISICYNEWVNGSYLGKGFTSNVLKRIVNVLNDRVVNGAKVFTVDKIQNKLENYKRCYHLHERCLQYSGSKWNNDDEKLSISDEARAAIIVLDPYNKQIIVHGCPNFDKCREMWMNSSATGEYAISSGGDMSVDSGRSAGMSTARNNTPLAFLQARDRAQAGGSCTRPLTAADERSARMQGYQQFQRFMAERPRQADKNDEIRVCVDEVEAMDVTEIQKMLGGIALREDSM